MGWIAISLNGGGRFLVDSGGAGVGFFFSPSIFWNATKHRKRNHFPLNHLHLKIFYSVTTGALCNNTKYFFIHTLSLSLSLSWLTISAPPSSPPAPSIILGRSQHLKPISSYWIKLDENIFSMSVSFEIAAFFYLQLNQCQNPKPIRSNHR